MNYVIGDIQGCFRGLQKLLKTIKFDPTRDKLWAVGDLIARGEDSLSTLALLYELGDQFSTVLGNHDLHFLSVACGLKKEKRADKLSSLLHSPEKTKYVDWLRQFPLAQLLDKHTLLIHAGLYPQWSVNSVLAYSNEVATLLGGEHYQVFLPQMYSKECGGWEANKHTPNRLNFVVNACTRMRFLNPDLSLNFSEKSAPADAPSSLTPWFSLPNDQLQREQRVIFGHWASLMGKTKQSNMLGLDTGYVWGNKLTCWCKETEELFSVDA